jgi:DedD protein
MDGEGNEVAADRQRLVGRIAFALLVLVALLASLAVFDHLNAPPPPAAPVDVRAPAPRPAPPVALHTPEQAPAASAEAAKAVVAEESAVPRGPATPPAVDKPVAPLVVEKPLTPPASGRHALMRAPDVAVPPAPTPVPRSEPPPTPRRAGEAPAVTRPLAQAAAKPFALQVGVFGDVANAEELRSRLQQAGIPASIEARVHVGPFASRAEADAARAKLRELGIAEAVLFSMKGARQP